MSALEIQDFEGSGATGEPVLARHARSLGPAQQEAERQSLVVLTPVVWSVSMSTEITDAVPPNHAGVGAKYGAIAGATVGLLAGLGICGSQEVPCLVAGPTYAVVAAVVGALAGALIGSFYPR